MSTDVNQKPEPGDSFDPGRLNDPPAFVRQVCVEGDPTMVATDAWVVTPTGDFQTDYKTGREHADAAVRYARAIRWPGFVAYVVECMMLKIRDGEIERGGMEAGYLQRVATLACSGSLN